MNIFLPTAYDELLHRLAVGIEPLDATRESRVPVPIEIARDRGPLPAARLEMLRERRRTIYDDLDPVPRHATRVHVVLWSRQEKAELEVRVRDPKERYVPRRLRVPVAALPTTDPAADLDPIPIAARTRRPVLYPGAAYPVGGAVTGFRGRVVFARPPDPSIEIPARWARIEARRLGTRVGFAHTDHKGEFLLLLSPHSVQDAQLPATLDVEVRVFAPADPPAAPNPSWLEEVDPHWDLPVETLAMPGVLPDPVADGTSLPAGYALRVTQNVQLTFGSFATSGATPLKVT